MAIDPVPGKMFSLCSGLVLPCWLLLVFVPRWRWTQRLATFVVPVAIAVVYVWMLATAPRVAGAGFNSIAEVRALFSVDRSLVAGWIHYLAFDLFIGAWETRDAESRGIAQWMVLPCLVLTFLFGPLGLGVYLVLRTGLKKKSGAARGELGVAA